MSEVQKRYLADIGEREAALRLLLAFERAYSCQLRPVEWIGMCDTGPQHYKGMASPYVRNFNKVSNIANNTRLFGIHFTSKVSVELCGFYFSTETFELPQY